MVREAGVCGGALLLIVVLELLALERPDVSLPRLLAPVAAVGERQRSAAPRHARGDDAERVGFYALASALDATAPSSRQRRPGCSSRSSPFAILQPLGYLVRTAEYSPRYDWIYLALALIVALLSQTRQRRASTTPAS